MSIESPGFEIINTPLIPEHEIDISYARSSGAGGQNVNKVSSKVILRWNIDASEAFTPEQKELIRRRLGAKVKGIGDVIITAQDTRSQLENKRLALQKLNELIAGSLVQEKPRVATAPTFSSEEQRVIQKKKKGEIKRNRKAPGREDEW
ncbi:MAG: alternative ribosome rescue aminoacyl-tRNA hydrolase ArfB [Candidatus Paceibacterota bacterium]|jgi:ribosome-associated protein